MRGTGRHAGKRPFEFDFDVTVKFTSQPSCKSLGKPHHGALQKVKNVTRKTRLCAYLLGAKH
jgi:hypothetical protein